MEKEQELFASIVKKMSRHKGVKVGRMMSAPGITSGGKVFAFYWKKEMIFRLGKEFDAVAFGLKEWHLLNPFKERPPMAGWFCVPYSESRHWEELARRALKALRASGPSV
ncbi:MAG: hypothetical protein QXJ74_04690 [Nitrososphaera sp.]|uniref:hypothetical protein n=1 Tax=Nitrososphaera sp. TaxID=1971748 RepID=UPI00317BC0AB